MKEKVILGKKKCICSFSLEADGTKCKGKASCDKKCSGAGTVRMGMFYFSLKAKKGKATIGKCKVEADITGSGSEPLHTNWIRIWTSSTNWIRIRTRSANCTRIRTSYEYSSFYSFIKFVLHRKTL